jgi:two-component system, chemotaxis family, chemotaxis protein CheY
MSTPAATTRFLVVDDFSTMRRILRNLLAEIGFRQVEEAGDGRAALELLRQGQVDFVISDINMPRIGGFELLRQIRADAALKDLPVLLITSEASKDDVLQAIRLGANGTILKPLTKSTLEEKVRNILLRSSAWPVGSARPSAKPAAQSAAAPTAPFLRAAPSARNA